MNITVHNEKTGTTTNVDTLVSVVKDLLHELSVNSETVLVARNSEILLPNDTIAEGDSLILLSVISGG